MRRVNRRMAQTQVKTYAEYLDLLEVHQDEFTALFNTILINVTGFFRDLEAWVFLSAQALPRLLAAKDRSSTIRLWSAGCASGEEAYTLAIVLAEALGPDEFTKRVKIYATDVDDDGLARARYGVYDDRYVANVQPELLDRYFEVTGNRFTSARICDARSYLAATI